MAKATHVQPSRRTLDLIRDIYPVQPEPFRMAIEDEDWPTLLVEIEARVTKDGDCWLWPKLGKDGYARASINKRSHGVHRLAAMADLGRRIPSHMPVHHKCGRPACVRPLHLQVVTPHENNAEMLERKHYRDRIAALEAALTAVDPTNPLLHA